LRETPASAQCRPRRVARSSPSVCDHPATPTSVRRPSTPRSNLGDASHPVISRPGFAPAAICSTYRAPTTRAHDTPSAAVGCERRSIRSVLLLAARELPCLQTLESFRRSESTSPPMTKVPSGGGSWWFRRTNHRGSAQRTPRRHVGSRALPTAPSDGRRSSARRYLCAPEACVSSSRKQGYRL
jgi:hypothetical protein